MQRALAEARATGRLGTGMRNRDRFPRSARRRICRRRSGAGRDRRRRASPTRICASSSRVPQGYLMSNGTDAVTISGSAGKAQFRGGQLQRRPRKASCSRFDQLDPRSAQLPVPPPQRRDDQRHAGGDHDGARQQLFGSWSTSASSLINGMPQHIYHFVMMTPGGYGVRSVRADGQFAAPDHVRPKRRRSGRGSSMSSRSGRATRSSRWRAGWLTAISSWIVFCR